MPNTFMPWRAVGTFDIRQTHAVRFAMRAMRSKHNTMHVFPSGIPDLGLALVNADSCDSPERVLEQRVHSTNAFRRTNDIYVVQICEQELTKKQLGLHSSSAGCSFFVFPQVRGRDENHRCSMHFLNALHHGRRRDEIIGTGPINGSHRGSRVQIGDPLQHVCNTFASRSRAKSVLKWCCGAFNILHQLLRHYPGHQTTNNVSCHDALHSAVRFCNAVSLPNLMASRTEAGTGALERSSATLGKAASHPCCDPTKAANAPLSCPKSLLRLPAWLTSGSARTKRRPD